MAGAHVKNSNYYIEEQDFIIGHTNNKVEFLIDKEDYDIVKQFCWRISNSGYIITNIRVGEKRYSVELHRLLINNFPYTINNNKDIRLAIDHINRNKLDNRRENLRIVDSHLNSFNSKIPKSNSSGVIGVYWHRKNEVWCATIKHNYKNIYLGSFPNKNLAILCRLKAEIKYFGELYAPQRHLFAEYEISMY